MTDGEVDAAAASATLAAEIAGLSAFPPTTEDTSGEGKEEKKPPDTSGEDTDGGKGEKQGKEGKEGKGDDDPLKGFDIQKLLAHPDLGPILQSWADTTANTVAEAAVDRERESISDTAINKYQEAQWAAKFKSLSAEDLPKLLTEDSEAATAYARYQESLKAASEGDPKAILRAGQTYAYAAQIATHDGVLEAAGLPDDVKATLDYTKFADQGPDGIVAWGEAIANAIIEHKATALATKMLEEKWETHRDEKLAEMENDGIPSIPTRKDGGVPDLLKTPSTSLLEQALATHPQDKEK